MQRRSAGLANVFTLLAAFLAASMLMGFISAGLVMPIVGGAGLTAKAAISTFDALPAQLTAPVLSQQTRILAKDGTPLATLFKENRSVVPLSAVSPAMRKAQIAIEDSRFYEHGGIDARGLVRAFVSTLRSDTQGASTITQQYVKQSLIANALRNSDEQAALAAQKRRGVAGVARKIQEAKFAIELEKKLSKDEILEAYLNLIFYGANSYGVEAAAQRYFGVAAKDLNLQQSAMIAGLAQQPDGYNPRSNPKGALERRNAVLDRMAATGAATPEEVAAAKATDLGLNVQDLAATCESAVDKWTCLYVQKWLELHADSLGKTPAERKARLLRGGLTVKTTLDANLIKETRQILTNWVPESRTEVGTSAAVVEPGTGKILAIGQSSAAAQHIVWSVDTEYGGSTGFAIGSTAKTYAIASALKHGMNANSTVNATPSGTRYDQNRFNAAACGAKGGLWSVHNVEGSDSGNMTLKKATVISVNTAFADLATKIGVCDTKALMKDIGLHQSSGKPYGDVSPSIILGANPASPLTMAASYAALAAGGTYCEPYPVESITQHDGKELPVKKGNCRETSVSPSVAFNTTQILKAVVPPNGFTDGRDAAAKTGTSDGNTHTWMVGYTPQRSTAVWTGRTSDNKPMPTINLPRFSGVPYGGSLSGPTWKRIMEAAHKDLPRESFKLIAQASADGSFVLPDLQGTPEAEARTVLQDAGLKVQVAPRRESSENVGDGMVISTNPSAGTKVKRGATVTLTISSGNGGSPRDAAQPGPAPAPAPPAAPGAPAPAPAPAPPSRRPPANQPPAPGNPPGAPGAPPAPGNPAPPNAPRPAPPAG